MSCYEGTPCITDCVMAELEKLGQKYRVALRCAQFCCHTVLFNAFFGFICFITKKGFNLVFVLYCIRTLHLPLMQNVFIAFFCGYI